MILGEAILGDDPLGSEPIFGWASGIGVISADLSVAPTYQSETVVSLTYEGTLEIEPEQ